MDYLHHLAISPEFWVGVVTTILVIAIVLLALVSLAHDDHLIERNDQAQFDADVANERTRLARQGLRHGPVAPAIYPATERRKYRPQRDILKADLDGFAQNREVLP